MKDIIGACLALIVLGFVSLFGCDRSPPSLATFNVKDYGAVGNGVHDDTPAILKAIEGAASAGGGRVIFEPSESPYVITDSILIDADNIHVEGMGATLFLKDGSAKGRNDPADYLHIILIKGTKERPVKNVSVTGLTIDANFWNQAGNHSAWQQAAKIAGHPRGIKVEYAHNVLIDKVTIRRPFVGMTFGLGSHDCQVRDTIVREFHHDGFGVTPKRVERGASEISFLRCQARDSMSANAGGPPGNRVKGWEVEEGAQDVKLIDCAVVNTSANGIYIRPHWSRGEISYLTGNVELIRFRVENAGPKGVGESFFIRAYSYRQPVRNVRLVDCYADRGNLAIVMGPENVEVTGGQFGQMTIGYYKDIDDAHHDPEGYWKFMFENLPIRSAEIKNVTITGDVRINAEMGHDQKEAYRPSISLVNVTIKGNLEIFGSESLVKMENCIVEGETRVAEAGKHAWQEFGLRAAGALSFNEKAEMTVARTTIAPEIDGAAEDACWQDAKSIAISRDLKTWDQREDLSVVRACYDQRGLYLLIECIEPNMDELLVTGDKRDDDAIWEGDCVEVFMHRDSDAAGYFRQWMINPSGVLYDGTKKGSAWNSSAKAAGKQLNDRYVVEIVIPWESLGGKLKKGESLKANFSRRQATTGTNWIWSWKYGAMGSLGNPKMMGTLNFE